MEILKKPLEKNCLEMQKYWTPKFSNPINFLTLICQNLNTVKNIMIETTNRSLLNKIS